MPRSSFPSASWMLVVAALAVGAAGAFVGTSDASARSSHARPGGMAVSFEPSRVTLRARTTHCAIAASAPPVQANVVCG